MLALIPSCALHGIDAYPVTIEVDVSSGLPGYHVVGLPSAPIREGAVRIRAALERVGQKLPNKKVTVNLAPADRRKDGAAFDLPIAIGVLAGDGIAPMDAVAGLLLMGELSLDGSLRRVRGVLAAALLARNLGLRGVLVPASSAAEAAEVDDIEVYGAAHISEVVAALTGEGTLQRARRGTPSSTSARQVADMSDVRGQAAARAALEVAVAGGHNALLVGPPGIGKTMLARRLPGILPPLSRDEALETTKIYSSAGLAPAGLITERPFRAPHHTVSAPALIGGGSPPRPGEVSLAHNGVLYLDELPEFPRASIEALRQPLEDRRVTIDRVRGSISLPASLVLVASANPCPCGWLGSPDRACTCSARAIDRYRSRLSGPLLDRIDIQIPVGNVALSDLRAGQPAETSEAIRARVVMARDRQARRLRGRHARTNAEMSPSALRATCQLTSAAEEALKRLHRTRSGMTARAVDRIIKVARTVADLSLETKIDRGAILEAASYRALDADGWTGLHQAIPPLAKSSVSCA
ncbi:MAG TPA: YifB family Mg chelatase-like AAA ATPase [Kofleriaceae bacterium]|nr:YifB family Mg chelatase-like AAA ATPase [Kofleriaceae bacterium]